MLSELSSTFSTNMADASLHSSGPVAGTPPSTRPFWQLLNRNGLVLIALALVVVPTVLRLAQQHWPTEAGAHGPIVLATGTWLLYYSLPELKARTSTPTPIWLVLLCLAPLIVLYSFGRALDLLALEVLAAIAMAFLLVVQRLDFSVLWFRPFPFLYLALLIPIPGWVMTESTMWLQHLISDAASWLLASFNYPVLQQGVVIYVAQYQLLVEDACSGMNSLTGLVAISLFYIYLLHRADWRHALLLTIAILPIAVFVNLLRVVTLILITYHFGDGVAQGFVHNFAGILLFALSLSLMVLVDLGIRRLMARRSVGEA